jgi:GH35 family endo-1,4-beta-xylanase
MSANAGEVATIATAAVTGRPFANALRIEVARKPPQSGAVQIVAPVDAAMAVGDVLMLSFWMRSAASAEATLDAGFRSAGTGFRGPPPLNMPASAGTEWKKVQFPFALARGYNKGEAEVFFTLGFREQTVEIGGIELISYGAGKRVADLPFTKFGYGGSELDAAWRKAAEERIERIRKGDLTVLVTDLAGKPIRGAEVSVRMRKHAFLFGTAVSGPALAGRRLNADGVAKYKQQIVELFNFAVMENDLKWPQWSVVESRPATLAAVDWLRENGLQVRGHNLVWPSWRETNVKAAVDAKNDPAALAKVILDHIAETTAALRGRVVDWDVINETFTNHDFIDLLGRHAMADWFQAARAGDPNAKLFINDFEILEGNDQAHQDDYAATIRYLIDQGAPVDGIGLQSHFPARLTAMDDLFQRLDRFAAFGRDLEITEFDINTMDEATQADYTRDFMTAVFSHPSVRAFLMWGFWEGSHWRPRGAMLRRDWSVKPNGEVYKDLVFKRWWTNADGKTSAQGTFAARGFLGDYEIVAKSGGKSKTVRASLPREGAKVECVVE